VDIFSLVDGSDWDKGSLQKSRQKHKVSPVECEEVFFNTPLIVEPDAAHSSSESRYFSLGRTDAGRSLFIVFTIRGKKMRIISARDMSRKERNAYDEKSKEDAEVQE